MLRPKLFMLWPSVEISMFPLILPYGIFVEAHSYGNAFFKVFKYRTKQNNTYLLTIVCWSKVLLLDFTIRKVTTNRLIVTYQYCYAIECRR